MASVGPQTVGTGTATNIGNAISWVNPGNITASDNTRATLAGGTGAITSNALDATNFDFSTVPSGATIDGVLVEIERAVSATGGAPRDHTVQLLIAGSASGSNLASGTNWTTSEGYFSYGSSTELWGLSITESDVKNSGFGVRLVVQNGNFINPRNYSVDHIRITVYYTAAGGGGSAVAVFVNHYKQQGIM